MKENYKDVTGSELQGCFGYDTCEGIDGPGKYIIRVIDYDFWDNDGCYDDPVIGPLCRQLDAASEAGDSEEYERINDLIDKAAVEKFGEDSDAWYPLKAEITKIYGMKQDGKLVPNVVKANDDWFYYNGVHGCFKPFNFDNDEEAMDYIKNDDRLYPMF